MLRNQDRPELLLFVTTNAARWTDGSARPGVERLVAEAKDAGTPSIWICEDDPKPVGGLEPTPWPNAPSLPCPQALQDARASIEIEPDGFGGGMGGAGGTRSVSTEESSRRWRLWRCGPSHQPITPQALGAGRCRRASRSRRGASSSRQAARRRSRGGAPG